MNVVRKHPNATAAAGSGGSAAALVTILMAFGVTIPLALAVWVVAAAPVIFLAIGQKGIKGIARQVWQGEESDTVVVTEAPVPVESVVIDGEEAEEK